MAHDDDDEYDNDLASAAGVDPRASPELDLTLATPAYQASFEADFSVFDRDQNFSGTYDAVESGESIYETGKNDTDDADWCDPRCPSRNYFTSPDIILMRGRNSELGSIVLSITKAGFEIELGNNRNYRAWEDVLLMDPQESVTRSWSV